MADVTYYNKEQVDEIIKNTKTQLKTEVDELMHVGTDQASRPTVADKALSIKVLRSETK